MTYARVILFALTLSLPALLIAQRRPIGDPIKGFVSVDIPVVALTNVRVIDGTGAPAREGQTIVISDGVIADIGDATRVTVPAGTAAIDLTGKSVIPGLVMVHEHLYYPAGACTDRSIAGCSPRPWRERAFARAGGLFQTG